MFDLWFILALIVPLLWAFANFYDKIIIEKVTGSGYSFLFYGNTLLIFSILWIYLTKEILFEFTLVNVILMFMGAGFINIFLLYGKALEIEESTKVIPLFSLITVFLLFIDLIIFKHSINSFEIFGVIIVILGSFLISSPSYNIVSLLKPRKVLFLMSLCSLYLAIHFSLIKYFAIDMSIWALSFYMLLGKFFGVLLPAILIKKNRIDIINSFNKQSIFILLIPGFISILDILVFVLYNYTLQLAPNTTLVSAVANLQHIYVFTLGTILSYLLPKYFKENISKNELIKKFISIGTIIFGVLLIQLF